MSKLTYKLKELFPLTSILFRKWWINQVIENNVPCDVSFPAGVKSVIFDDWPFEMQAMYYSAFFAEQNFKLSLSLVTKERFEGMIEGAFGELEKLLTPIKKP